MLRCHRHPRDTAGKRVSGTACRSSRGRGYAFDDTGPDDSLQKALDWVTGSNSQSPLYHSGKWVPPPHPSLDQGNNLQQPLRKVCCVCPWPLGHPA